MTSCVLNFNPGMFGKGKTIKCKGPVVTRSFAFDGFEKIVVNGSSDMEISQADVFRIDVIANEEVFDYLDYKVENNTLVIDTKDHVNIKAEEYDIVLALPCLTSLEVNGAADVDMKQAYVSDKEMVITVNGAGDFDFNGITVPEFSIELNGAGDIEADGLDVGTLSIQVNGAGDVDLSGKAGSAIFSVSGAGDIDASKLDCADVQTHKSGIASIKLK